MFNFNPEKMKMYKSYVSVATVAVLLLALGGCNKGFLDKDPLDRLSSGQFWETKQDFDMALTALYGNLQNDIFSFGTPNWDLITDNGYGQHNYNGSQAIVQGDISPSSGGYIADVYNRCYSNIARVNLFLSKLANAEQGIVDDAVKAQYEGEARFMNAFYYFLLYACYGDVPLVTEPLTLENQIQPKVPAAEILNYVLTEVDAAIASLPAVRYSDGAGHAVKSTAQALKLRVLMFAAYGDTGTPDQSILAQARDVAQDIMDVGYILAPDFESVFRDGTQEGNPEIIFSVKFLAPDNATAMHQWHGHSLVASPLHIFFDASEADDIRRDLTICQNVVNFDGNIHRPSKNMPTKLRLKKLL